MNISISYVSISITGQAAGAGKCDDGDCKQPRGIDNTKSTVGNEVRQRAHAFNELRQALKSGNIDDAKKAFEALEKNLQETTDKSGKNPFAPDTKLGKKLAALGAAIESGDLSEAKQAFRALTHAMRHAHRAHQHQGGAEDSPVTGPTGGAGSSTTETPAPLTSLNVTA